MEKLDDILRQYVAQGDDTKNKILGASFVVTDKEGVIYSGSAGRTDLPKDSASFNDKSVSWVASLTKFATSTCIMQLVEQGQLRLDDDVRKMIPEVANAKILREFDGKNSVMEENTKPITMRHLLTHTSGYHYEFSDPVLLDWCRAQGREIEGQPMLWTKDEITLPLRFEPGESWGYGIGLDWAGQVLEHITGKTLGQYMKENIFDPLGIKDTGFWSENVPQTPDRLVKIVARNAKTMEIRPTTWTTPTKYEIHTGGSGLFTTASDYACFLRGWLQGKLLKESTMRDMLKPQLSGAQYDMFNMVAYLPMVRDTFAPEFPEGAAISHCLGGMVNMEDIPGKRRRLSVAWSGVLNSRWWLDPETGVAAVLIVNIRPHADPIVARLYDQLEPVVYGELLPNRRSKPSTPKI